MEIIELIKQGILKIFSPKNSVPQCNDTIRDFVG